MTTPDDSLDALFHRLKPERIARLKDVVRHRMKGLTVLLEGLYDAGNRSAVYRSAEAFGLTDVHVAEPEAATKLHARAVSRGAEKWVDIHEWPHAPAAVDALHARGFKVYAADLHAARPLESLDFSQPVALAFGNEHNGITESLRDAADGSFLIPMAGFTSSFNIAVAAAIALHHARLARERALGATTDLSPDERDALLHEFARRSSRWLNRVQQRGAGKEAGLKPKNRAARRRDAKG